MTKTGLVNVLEAVLEYPFHLTEFKLQMRSPRRPLDNLLSNYIRIKDVLVCDGNDIFLHIVIDKYSGFTQIIGYKTDILQNTPS